MTKQSQNLTAHTLRTSLAIAVCLCSLVCQLPAGSHAASPVRVSVPQRQTNQYFLTEFCNLESKTLWNVRNKQSVQLNNKSSASSVRIKTKQQVASAISFDAGSSKKSASEPIFKQLNCTVNVLAPASHGLLVTVNSIGLPKNLTKLSLILNQGTPHAKQVNLEGETKSANYLLTHSQSSKISINLQSFTPIDWSRISFDILFSVYKKGNSSGCPNNKWFDCGDDICVPSSLVCDNNRNCPNGNDEMIFYRCYSPLVWSIGASIILAFAFIVAIISSFLYVRRRRLNKETSLSNNELNAEQDLIQDRNSSKLDLTQESARKSSSYLAKNLYLAGFENPAWSNGTLTKNQNNKHQLDRDNDNKTFNS